MLFYRRLAGRANKFVRKATVYLIGFSIFYVIVVDTVVLNMCKKVSDFWSLEIRAQSCNDAKIHYIISVITVLSIIADTVMLLLPVKMIWQTKLSPRDRAITISLLLVGFSYVILQYGSIPELLLTLL